MAGRRRILLVAAGVSIGIHLATALLILVLPRILPKDDRQPEQGTIELVMEEHKGAEPGAPGEPKPDQPPLPNPPTPDAPKADAPAPTSGAQPSGTQEMGGPPIDPAREEAVPPPVERAQPNASPTHAPTIAEQPRQASQPATEAAPTFNFREAESEYDAVVLGGGVIPATPDTKFRNRPPDYSFEAATKGEHGRVVVVAHVGPNGVVRGVDVVEGTGFPDLDRSAVAAVEKWRFHPAMKDGQGVAFDFQFGFIFGPD